MYYPYARHWFKHSHFVLLILSGKLCHSIKLSVLQLACGITPDTKLKIHAYTYTHTVAFTRGKRQASSE